MAFILSNIFVYPVKSLAGIQLDTAKILSKGLEHDRRWMIIDEQGQCMTQRVFPDMALFKTLLEDDKLVITFKGEHINIRRPEIGNVLVAKVWDDQVEVIDGGDEYATWFSERLGVKCRLVYFPEINSRPIDKKYAFRGEHVSLADAYPILLIGQSSLDDLNARMNSPLPMNRFRPNIVVIGTTPYAEDKWSHFKLGSAKLKGVKPCSRCVLTTVDQDSAIKGREPLVTLSKYRARNNKIYFGQNVMVVKEGIIKVGDEFHLEDDNYY